MLKKTTYKLKITYMQYKICSIVVRNKQVIFILFSFSHCHRVIGRYDISCVMGQRVKDLCPER